MQILPACLLFYMADLSMSMFCAGDVNSIKIGENSNVQDNCVVHVAKHNAQDRALPTVIGNNVTIGKPAQHAMTISALSMLCSIEGDTL